MAVGRYRLRLPGAAGRVTGMVTVRVTLRLANGGTELDTVARTVVSVVTVDVTAPGRAKCLRFGRCCSA